MTQLSFHSTPRTGRDFSLNNYQRQLATNSSRRAQSGVFRTRILKNNVRGKPVDKITQQQMRPDLSDCVSTYQQDFDDKQPPRRLQTSEGFRSKTFQTDPPMTPQSLPKKPAEINQEYGLQLNENLYTPEHTQRTPYSMRESGTKTSPKKKMMYSTQWEPFFNLPKKGNQMTLNYRGPGRSLYQRDYTEHNNDERGTVMTNDFYTTAQKRDSMDYRTTMKSDYKDWNMGPPRREGAKRGIDHETPFGGRSNYRSEFVDWGTNAHNHERVSQPLTIVRDVPFKHRTTYNDNYHVPKKEDDEAEKMMTKKRQEGVFTQTIPFLGETSYQKTFRPFRVGGNADYSKKQADYNSVNSYQGQFRTTFGTDFSHPKQRIYWPGENEAEDEYLSEAHTYHQSSKMQ